MSFLINFHLNVTHDRPTSSIGVKSGVYQVIKLIDSHYTRIHFMASALDNRVRTWKNGRL